VNSFERRNLISGEFEKDFSRKTNRVENKKAENSFLERIKNKDSTEGFQRKI